MSQVGQETLSLQEARRLLGLPAVYDPARVRRAYRRWVRDTHPDAAGADEVSARTAVFQALHPLVEEAAKLASAAALARRYDTRPAPLGGQVDTYL